MVLSTKEAPKLADLGDLRGKTDINLQSRVRPCLFVTDKTRDLFKVLVLLLINIRATRITNTLTSLYCNQSHHGIPLYFNYDNDTTLISNSTPTSAIAVVGTQ